MQLLNILRPQITAKAEQNYGLDENAIIEFIRTTTMVGVFRVPAEILVRKYIETSFTNLWFTTFLWGVVFLRNQASNLILRDSVSLFTIASYSSDSDVDDEEKEEVEKPTSSTSEVSQGGDTSLKTTKKPKTTTKANTPVETSSAPVTQSMN